MAHTILSGARATDFPSENSVSLSALQVRGIALEWFEAIAIAQALCASMEPTPYDLSGRSLASTHVIIHAEGRVVASRKSGGDGSNENDVHRFGRFLRDLLPQTFPTPLRLALSQAMSTPPFYGSVEELSRALEYFERPNRSEVIQAIYQRWNNAADQIDVAPVVPRQDREPEQSRPTPQFPLKRLVHAGIMVIAAFAVTAILMVAVEFVRGGGRRQSIRETSVAAIQSASSAVDSMLDRVLPAPKTAETPAPPQEPDVPVAEPSSKSKVPGQLGTNKSYAENQISALNARIAAFDLKQPVPSMNSPATSAELQTSEHSSVQDDGTAGVIYSDADTEVVPPVAVYPNFPTALPAGVTTNDVAAIELVIAGSGRVESVKVRQAPSTMSDAMVLTMSLSAAKTWRFEPATKDGKPVRYRKSIWIMTR